jgi:hypothetical protein
MNSLLRNVNLKARKTSGEFCLEIILLKMDIKHVVLIWPGFIWPGIESSGTLV